MPGVKRRAEDPLLPIRAPKHPRTSQSSPSHIEAASGHWGAILRHAQGMVMEFTGLVADAAKSIAGVFHRSDFSVPPQITPPPTPPESSRRPLPSRSQTNLRESSPASPQIPTPAPTPKPRSPPRTVLPPRPPPAVHKVSQKPTQVVANSGILSPPSSHAASSSVTSSASGSGWQYVGEALLEKQRKAPGPKKPYITRDHIHAKRHKARVEEVRQKDREMMERELYEQKLAQGYASDFVTFKSFTRFQAHLEREVLLEALSPSRSVVDLRAPPQQQPDSRRHSYHDDFLQRALDRAKKSLDGPKPAPFTLTADQLRAVNKKKDREIEYRIHGKPIPVSLPPDDEAFVDSLLDRRGVIAKCGREQVTDKDLSRLQPAQWLNDEVINFYGQMILDRSECKENTGVNGKGKNKLLNIYYLSTFFWPKLKVDGYERGRLARWTKKVDIFSKNIILLPINHGNVHWTAAAINFDKKRIESHDSMGMSRKKVFELLREYLDAEHRNKKKRPFDFTGWTDFEDEDLPRQENGWDCGVFTCQFLEAMSRGEETFAFKQTHMLYFRRRMMWEIGKVKLRDGP